MSNPILYWCIGCRGASPATLHAMQNVAGQADELLERLVDEKDTTPTVENEDGIGCALK